MKRVYVLCLCVLMAVIISACGASSGSASAPKAAMGAAENAQADGGSAMAAATAVAYDQASMREAPSMVSGSYTGASWDNQTQPEKIIKTGTVELATEHFDDDKARLETLTSQMGGFIESSNEYRSGINRRYEAVLRVPGERFAEMKKAVEATGKLLSSNENEQNVTGQYYDAKGRLESKRVEEARVLDMIGKATDVDTQLTLEEYLGRLRTDIDVLDSQIKDIDSLSSFSTLNVNLAETDNVKLLADTGNFGQKLGANFRASVKATGSFFGNVLVFLAGAAIPLALIALLAFVCYIIIKKITYRFRKEKVSP